MKGIIVLCLALVFSASAMAAKIAKVDVQKVLLTVEEGKKVRSSLKKKFDQKQKIIKKEEDKIRKMQQDLQKQSLIIDDKARLKKEKAIQEKIVKLQQKTMNFQKEIQDQENKMKRPILEKVRGVIETISKKGGFDMVFEVTTSPIYVKEVTDITEQVVKAYNKK